MLNESLENVKNKITTIEIYGLGYVGFPLAVRLGTANWKITGIDTNHERIQRLKENHLMDSEVYLKDEYMKCRSTTNLELKHTPIQSSQSKIGIICVPTPIPNEKIKSDVYVISAVQTFLKFAKKGDIIILESSIEVGTTEKIMKIVEDHGFQIGNDFGICFCPERIDPANKEWGIENIPRIIYCSDDTSFKIAKEIYQNVNKGNLLRVSKPKIAEVVKSFENAFRLVNISLVNELAILCDKLGINVNEIIDAAATKPFGFLPHYPGAGAGGHCIPKDPRFLLETARKMNSKFVTIENAIKINENMPVYVSDSIEQKINQLNLEKSILVCGLAYKPNVEDMRDSSSFKIIEEFIKKDFNVFGYDPFFKQELTEKYLIENHISELNFKIINELNDETIKEISCLCIVQHHEQSKKRISEIYEKSLVPFIYDCQGKLKKISNSDTHIEILGN